MVVCPHCEMHITLLKKEDRDGVVVVACSSCSKALGVYPGRSAVVTPIVVTT